MRCGEDVTEIGLLYAWESIVDSGLGTGRGNVPSPVGVKVYWLDINYLMLWSSLRADLTSKSIGDPKACKVKQETHNTYKYWIICNILLMNIHV